VRQLDGRQPIIGFDGGVRQMFDQRVQFPLRRRSKKRAE
jgi:hypothetical protein